MQAKFLLRKENYSDEDNFVRAMVSVKRLMGSIRPVPVPFLGPFPFKREAQLGQWRKKGFFSSIDLHVRELSG